MNIHTLSETPTDRIETEFYLATESMVDKKLGPVRTAQVSREIAHMVFELNCRAEEEE